MSYIQQPISDDESTSLVASVAFTSSGVTSSSLDVRRFKEVDFFIYLADKGSATTISFIIQGSHLSSPTSSDWFNIKSEEITDGAAPQSDYEPSLALSGFGASEDVPLMLSCPVRGRVMRIIATPDATTGAGTIVALRRV